MATGGTIGADAPQPGPRISLAEGGAGVVAQRLPPLRDEIILHPGPADREGAPGWTLEEIGRAHV